MTENMFAKKAVLRSQKVSGAPAKVKKPERVKFTLSMTKADREALESMANAEGVTIATLIHMWIAEHSEG